MNSRRITVTLGAAGGGLLATALLTTAFATADELVYEPNESSFVQEPSYLTGFSPSPISLPPLFDQETGTEWFQVVDATTHSTSIDAMYGDALVTNFLGGSETQFVITGTSSPLHVLDALPSGDITLWQLPLGFGDELVSSSEVPLGLEDIVITPFGDFTL